jgi:acyl transferase domain-containing protein
VNAVLALEKGYISANAGFETSNPKLRLEEWGLALPLGTMPWLTPGLRRVSINSFGFGGSNAYVILDDAHDYFHSRCLMGNHQTLVFVDDSASSASDSVVSDMHGTNGRNFEAVSRPPKVLALSAHDQGGIKRYASTYAKFAEEAQIHMSMKESSYTTWLTLWRRGGPIFTFRSFAVASSLEDRASSVSAAPTLKRPSKNGALTFVFTG